MKRVSPIVKISFGLVMVTVSLWLIGDVLGIMPNEQRGLLDGRKKFCESLAIQFSLAVTGGDVRLVDRTLKNLVERQPDILSAALITDTGSLLAGAGDHRSHWKAVRGEKSTATHVQVPVFWGTERWGRIQLAFASLPATRSVFSPPLPQIHPLFYFMCAGFGAYWLFMKRALRELDPGSVVPDRVKSAFNALAEGLAILDEKGHIVLTNETFARRMECPADSMLGRDASGLPWQRERRIKRSGTDFPWEISLRERKRLAGIPMRYQTERDGLRTFMVNTSPILGPEGTIRGVLATFDDLTDLEAKQIELEKTIAQLNNSREALREKTVKLEYLATHDPLTGCLNRRAFFEKCELLVQEAHGLSQNLSCIMADIDHFKSINDRYGHAIGDQALQIVANELRANARPGDIIGRYGGEEFCILMPGATSSEATVIAERLRVTVKGLPPGRCPSPMRLTLSFGVADLAQGVSNFVELIDRADKALYVAKGRGRNRVVGWAADLVGDEAPAPNTATARRSAGARNKVHRIPHGRPGSVPAKNAVRSNDELKVLRHRISELEDELCHSQEILNNKVGRDALTGLPNRLLFFDRIAQALARGQRYHCIAAVIVLDIGTVQRVNEALGTVIGDQVIKTAATRLSEILRSTDVISYTARKFSSSTISRIGNEEFGILVTDLKDVEAVTWIAKRMMDCLSSSLEIDGTEIFITCNAGISLFPHDSDEPERLIANASAARYRAKQQPGNNSLQFYSIDINQESYRQLWVESQLHHALEKGEFSLHFQPKVDLTTGRIASMEALIRWNNAKMGWVPPDEFISIAERTGLIIQIGEWVIRTACEQARGWMDAGFHDVGVAVNLSPLQLRQEDFNEHIRSVLREYGLEAEQLELEITESMLMDTLDTAVEMLNRLADIGVKIAVDDFGTGYSSLAYLKHFPITTLKIDRSFLSDTIPDKHDKLILGAIIAMAHSMNLAVVAEGVENSRQREFLRLLECDQIQGFLISRGIPGDQVLELLRTYNSETAYRETSRFSA